MALSSVPIETSADGCDLPTCLTCNQKARSLDMFMPEDTRTTLKWSKFGKNKATGIRDVEQGNECGCCTVTRLKNFGGISQEKLMELKDSNEELNSAWESKRRYNTSKGRKTYERLDLTAYKKEEVYSDVFQDGEITPIDDFLKDKGFSPLDFGSTKEKLEFVEQELGARPYDDNGVPSVIEMTGKKKIKIGQRSAIGKKQERKFETGRGAAEQHRADARGMLDSHKSWGKSTKASIDKKVAALRQNGSDAEDSPLAIKDGTMSDSGSDKEFGFSSNLMGSQPSGSRSRKRSPSPGGDAPGRSKKRNAAPSHGDHPMPSTATASKLRSSTEEAACEKAQAALDKAKESFSEEKLWETKIRARQIENVSNSLATLSTPLSSSENLQTQTLCKDMMHFAEKTEKIFKLFQAVRQAPLESIKALTDEHKAATRMLCPPVISKVSTWLATQALKDLENDATLQQRTEALFHLMSLHREVFTLRTYAEAAAKDSGEQAPGPSVEPGARGLQLQLFSMWIDKVFRAKNEQKFRRLVAPAPSFAVKLHNFDAEAPLNFEDGENHCNKLRLETFTLKTMTKDFEAAGPIALSSAKAVIDAKGRLSMKFQSSLKSSSTMRSLWTSLEEVSLRAMSSGSMEDELKKALSEFPAEKFHHCRGIGNAEGLLELMADHAAMQKLQSFCQASQRFDAMVEEEMSENPEGQLPQNSEATEVNQLMDSMTSFFQRRTKESLEVLRGQLAAYSKWGNGGNFQKDVSTIQVIIKNAVPVLQMLKVDGWEKVDAAAAVEPMMELLKAFQDCFPVVQKIEQELTLDGFITCSAELVKIVSGQHLRSLKEFQSSAPEGCPDACLDFISLIVKAFDEVAMKPKTWVACLLQQGRAQDLVDLKASVKASLGGPVQDICNGAEILLKFDSKEGILSKASYESKSDVKEALMSLMQLKSLQTDELIKCLPDTVDKYNAAKGKISQCISDLAANMKATKTECLPFHQKFSKVLECCSTWDFGEVGDLIDNTDSENGKQVEAAMKGIMPGLAKIQDAEELLSTVVTWLPSKDSLGLEEKMFGAVSEAMTSWPTASMLGLDILAPMAVELLLREHGGAIDKCSEILVGIDSLQKYAAKTLKINRKDWPKVISDRVEKAVKDLKKVVDNAKMPPPAVLPSPSPRRGKGKGHAKPATESSEPKRRAKVKSSPK